MWCTIYRSVTYIVQVRSWIEACVCWWWPLAAVLPCCPSSFCTIRYDINIYIVFILWLCISQCKAQVVNMRVVNIHWEKCLQTHFLILHMLTINIHTIHVMLNICFVVLKCTHRCVVMRIISDEFVCLVISAWVISHHAQTLCVACISNRLKRVINGKAWEGRNYTLKHLLWVLLLFCKR